MRRYWRRLLPAVLVLLGVLALPAVASAHDHFNPPPGKHDHHRRGCPGNPDPWHWWLP